MVSVCRLPVLILRVIVLCESICSDMVMPKKGSRLTGDQIALLRAWIDQGAVWNPGVTFARAAPRNLARRSNRVFAILNGCPARSRATRWRRQNSPIGGASAQERTKADLDVVTGFSRTSIDRRSGHGGSVDQPP